MKNKMLRMIVTSALFGTALLTPYNALAAESNKSKLPSDLDSLSESAKESIRELYEKGLLTGYDDGTFKPNKEISRAEFATMLVRALQLKGAENEYSFYDSLPGDWHYNSINVAYENDLLKGDGKKMGILL